MACLLLVAALPPKTYLWRIAVRVVLGLRWAADQFRHCTFVSDKGHQQPAFYANNADFEDGQGGIRATDIQSGDLVALKRRNDASNQDRTDVVEQLDDLFIARFRAITPSPSARLNSETPAWLLDRISILQLKIYHFEEQVQRADASEQHKNACQAKLDILYIQNKDMLRCFDELMQDLQDGTKLMKVYRQMKMYNDAALNPVLYKK